MNKYASILLIVLLLSCEEVVVVGLPQAQNLITVEGWLTNVAENQYVLITRSNAFSEANPVSPVTDASVIIQSRRGETFLYQHTSDGFYLSADTFSGTVDSEYRVRVRLSDGREIRSEWEQMLPSVPINSLQINSFEENDPDNPNQQFTVFFPKLTTIDPADRTNQYRWIFFRNGEAYTDPESITIQDDRFFNGNLIPNDFRQFEYVQGDEVIVQFQSITRETFNYLDLLKTQITSLGTSSGTTPATVTGNLRFLSTEEADEIVLGYFGTVAASSDTIVVQ